MRLYHATNRERAEEIEREGFRDTENTDGCRTDQILRGVFFADRPLEEQDGTHASGALFAIDVDEARVAAYEVASDCADYRQWCIPETVVNSLKPRRWDTQRAKAS